jgi:hypothetical protein
MKDPNREDLNVDFEVVSRELTAEESKSLKEFLRANKAALQRKNVRPTRHTVLHRKVKSGK